MREIGQIHERKEERKRSREKRGKEGGGGGKMIKIPVLRNDLTRKYVPISSLCEEGLVAKAKLTIQQYVGN